MLASSKEFGQAKKILVILHQAHSTTGRVGRLLASQGFTLDARYPALDDELPTNLASYHGVVVFGGPMCANDGDEWLRREIEWLKTPLREGKPFLGLCLGAQLMARQLGARVHSAASRRGEFGYHPLNPTPTADNLCCASFPRYAYQWHHDGFDIPSGAQRLAEGVGEYPNQAYIYAGNVVGLQFHPEVTYHMICRWTTRGAARLCLSGSQAHDHRQGWFQHDRELEIWISSFLSLWANSALNWPETPKTTGFAVAAE